METQLWAIAIKGSSSEEELKNAVAQLANVFPFRGSAGGGSEGNGILGKHFLVAPATKKH